MWIFDAGHAIRQVKPRDTYREYYTDLLKWILLEREARASSVVIATDDYRAGSTKEGERRSRRGGCEGRRVYVTGLEQKMPKGSKWSDFLNNGQNKNDLMSLFGDFLKGDDAINMVNGIPLSFYGKEEVWNILPRVTLVQQKCNHGEAGTKIPLFASTAESNVIAVATDCDVLVLLVATYAKLRPQFQWQMRYENYKYANIEGICNTLGYEASSFLSHFHAFSGCDVTSYFFNVGKIMPFKRAVEKGKLHLLKLLGAGMELSEDGLNNCKTFIRTVVYRGRPNETYLQTRIRLYVQQSISSKSRLTIPPDEDSCNQVVYRAHLQAFILTSCTLWLIPYINPLQNGWKKSDNTLFPHWFMELKFLFLLLKRDMMGMKLTMKQKGKNGNM